MRELIKSILVLVIVVPLFLMVVGHRDLRFLEGYFSGIVFAILVLIWIYKPDFKKESKHKNGNSSEGKG